MQVSTHNDTYDLTFEQTNTQTLWSSAKSFYTTQNAVPFSNYSRKMIVSVCSGDPGFRPGMFFITINASTFPTSELPGDSTLMILSGTGTSILKLAHIHHNPASQLSTDLGHDEVPKAMMKYLTLAAVTRSPICIIPLPKA